MTKEESGKETILTAIRRAAAELGRAPSRGELRRITGVSHYRVMAAFPTLREAVRAAGLEPNPKGEKISTENLLADWKRVAEKLGRRPSRAEYVREGRYSAGAFVGRFGSWSRIGKKTYHGGTEIRRKAKEISRELTRKTRINQKPERTNHKGHEETQRGKRSGDLVIGGSGYLKSERVAVCVKQAVNHKRAEVPASSSLTLSNFDRVPRPPVPAPLVEMRRVTEAVAQMVVNTLLAPGNWQLAVGQNQMQNPFTTEVTEEHGGGRGRELTRRSRICGEQAAPESIARGIRKESDLGPSLAVNTPLVQDDDLRRCDFAQRGIRKDRAVMGEPFDRRPMTNAPVNELGVDGAVWDGGGGAGFASGVGAGEVSGLHSQAAGCAGEVAASAD